MYLAVSIRFLSDRYHGRTNNGRDPEWPPSPLRLYQALLAGAAARWHDSAVREKEFRAFTWLEGLEEPPVILAPRGQPGRPILNYVPENLSDIDPDKRGAKVSRPTLFCGEPFLTYYWAINARDKPLAQIIAQCARRCRAVGWGIDMVIGTGDVLGVEPSPQTREKWVPMKNAEGGVALRVQRPASSPRKVGTLSELTKRFGASLNRITVEGRNPVPPLTAYRVVSYRRTSDPPPRPFAAFRLLHPTEDRAAIFPTTKANDVAAMTRHTIAQLAEPQGRSKDWIDRYVHGHRQPGDGSEPRFSYLPLPSLERRGERGIYVGAIRRVLVAELFDAPESHVPWLRTVLPGQFLIDEQTKAPKAMLAPLTPNDWVLRQYTDPAQTWATVTPVVLPGSDDGKFAKAEKLFVKALRQAGFAPDTLAELEFRNVSFWPGGQLALRFHRPNYLRNNHWSVYHVRLRWKDAIPGPLALGAGRHCGLGIFAGMRT